MRMLLVVMMLGTLGCASWSGRDRARMESAARADDARCTDAGFTYDSPRYTSCRYQLAEARQNAQVHEQSLGTSIASSGYHTDLMRQPEGIYRPIDVERFRCEARGEGAARLILCEEK
jgi:hypothetical protein